VHAAKNSGNSPVDEQERARAQRSGDKQGRQVASMNGKGEQGHKHVIHQPIEQASKASKQAKQESKQASKQSNL
jgi:hypothetical protein